MVVSDSLTKLPDQPHGIQLELLSIADMEIVS